MCSDPVIKTQGLGKCYQIYDQPRDRLLQLLLPRGKQRYREFWTLKEVSLEIRKGEALGLPVMSLPSTSPANASWSFERKLAAWRAAFEQAGVMQPLPGPSAG